MFVGVGASRVRDLFEQAKQNSPCIIFVDEIDAVGRQRGAGLGGGHDEREQTLNQLLVEMDGFGERQGVILIAATNRPDILDPALLRPGRFDRQIPVSSPDLAGRKAVLRVHSQGKPLAPDADLDGLAKRTVGMSGADLANVINEAALLTARENGTVITGAALEEAVDRVIGGPRRKGRIISETGEEDHRLPRGRPHPGGVGDARHRTDLQGHHPGPRPHRRPRRLGARGRQGPDDPLGDDRPAGVRDGRPRRRGTGVPRAHHRRGLRYRAGHQDRPRDGHRVRHERQARCGPLRHRTRRPVPGPHHGHPGRLQPRGGPRHRRRGPQAHRGRPHRGVGDPHRVPRRARHPRRRIAGEGNPAPRRAAGDLRRRAEAPAADGVRRLRSGAFRRTSRRSRRRASWPSSAANRGPSRCPNRRSRRRSPRPRPPPSRAVRTPSPNGGNGNGAHAAGPGQPAAQQRGRPAARLRRPGRLACAGLAAATPAAAARLWYPPPPMGTAARGTRQQQYPPHQQPTPSQPSGARAGDDPADDAGRHRTGQ